MAKNEYEQSLKKSLTLKDLIIYGLIIMVPIAPFGIYGSVAQASKGMVVLAYAIGMIGMIFTAFSYARMSEVFPVAGSVYAYASKGINETVGFFAGWAILLDYILIPALLYVVSAAALTGLFPNIPTYVWIIGFIVINTIINLIGIEFTAKFNKIVLIGQLIIFIIFVVMAFIAVSKGVNGSSFTIKPIYDETYFSIGTVMSAVSIAVLSFLGFDGISTLAEETKGGNKTVGKATVTSLIIVGILFIILTYMAASLFPNFNGFENIDTAFYEIAEIAGGKWLMLLCSLATAFAWGVANALAAQAAVSRVLFSMARDRLLPKPLSKIHSKYKTPYISTIFVAVVSLVISIIYSEQIASLTVLVNFGALTSFLILNVTVIYYFLVKKKSKDYFKHLVLPLIGFMVILYVWINLDPQSIKLGSIWIGIGVVYYLILRFVFKTKPTSLEI